MTKWYVLPNCGFFETFLHVEEEFIAKKFFASCPFKGRANHCRPIQAICPNGLDWPVLVSLALKRTWWKNFFGYFLLFYRPKGFKKTEIWKYISFCHLNPNGTAHCPFWPIFTAISTAGSFYHSTYGFFNWNSFI